MILHKDKLDRFEETGSTINYIQFDSDHPLPQPKYKKYYSVIVQTSIGLQKFLITEIEYLAVWGSFQPIYYGYIYSYHGYVSSHFEVNTHNYTSFTESEIVGAI